MPSKPRPLVLKTLKTGCIEVISHRPNTVGHVLLWRNNKPVQAHRLAWEEAYGPIPEDLCVCHICDNPRCVNPKHLFLGSQADNMRDKALKGRAARGERHGSAKLTVEQIYEIRQHRCQRQQSLADKYGVCRATIGHILSGRTWGWLNKNHP